MPPRRSYNLERGGKSSRNAWLSGSDQYGSDADGEVTGSPRYHGNIIAFREFEYLGNADPSRNRICSTAYG